MDQSQGRGARAEAAIALTAAAQHGVFTRDQAFAAGFTARMIGQRLERERWVRVDARVYRATPTKPTWELGLMAACLAGPAVASHRAASRLWQFPGFDDAAPEVTAYRHRRRRPTTVVWHESWFLTESRDTTALGGIPATSATRTIIDLSRVATVEEIEIALDNACHRGLTTPLQIQEQIARLRRRNGTRRIKSVLELKITDNNPPAESPLESRAAIAIREGGLPSPVAQFRVFDGRTFVGRVDFAWPDQHVILEVDGFSVHGDRAAWERDRTRQSRLAAAGWRVHHVTHERLADPRPVIADLRRSLGVH